ncbi:hypothetical protein ROHU_030264 [Labeo rohita]|uniref:Uncharacterized protein n=1 Tax=Labeo rohita TaxID=84645 RepID=A0A498LSG6_LABRO|nr:hypothetical protein ROHU_030264 [Labeo rohita]
MAEFQEHVTQTGSAALALCSYMCEEGWEGLGRSSEADGVSVVKKASTRRTGVGWGGCDYVALVLSCRRLWWEEGWEGLGRSSEADGVSVVKKASTRRTGVGWGGSDYVALVLSFSRLR